MNYFVAPGIFHFKSTTGNLLSTMMVIKDKTDSPHLNNPGNDFFLMVERCQVGDTIADGDSIMK